MDTIETEILQAYADCHMDWEIGSKIRNLNFRASQAVDPKTAKAILEKAMNGYNSFTPDLLDLFPEDCQITIAREGSVCLYVKPGKKKLPKGKEINADEIDKYGEEIRFWWD